MKRLLITAFLASSCAGFAQYTNIYVQDFGTWTSLNISPLSAVGWVTAAPNTTENLIYSYNGLSQFYTWPPTANLTNAYYTTDTSGSGPSGNVAFTTINPTMFTNLTFTVGVQRSYLPENETVRFAVRVGSQWYASVATMATPISSTTYNDAALAFNPAGSNWYMLTIGSTNALIGSQPAGDLIGSITGAGIVGSWSGAQGSWNFSNFRISGIPTNAVPVAAQISWFPQSQSAYVGSGVSFSVTTSNGTPPFGYQWVLNGTDLVNGGRISGATNSTLVITDLELADAGQISVAISNIAGVVQSSTDVTTLLDVTQMPANYLYAERFPMSGPDGSYPISIAGWANAVPDAPYRVWRRDGGDGAVFSYQAGTATTAFFTTNQLDTGLSGVAFPSINPDAYPAVSFSVDIAPSWTPPNVTAYIAVKMAGGSWFVGASPLPVDTTSQSATFMTYSQQFDRLAAQWRTLTLSATGATIGTTPASNLAGNIVGAGVVFVTASGGGNFDMDNFLITTDATPPAAPSITFSPWSQTVYRGGGVSFAVGAAGTRPFSYFWQKDGAPLFNGGGISGANSNVLTVVNVQASDAGQYSVIVSNTAGTDSSANYITTVLTVNDPPLGLLYWETFPYVLGPGTDSFPLSAVGWENAVPNNQNRLFQLAGGDGAAFAYQNGTSQTAFFSTPTFDAGRSGLPFPALNLAYWPSLSFGVDIAPFSQASNVTAYICVQMDGGPWYVSALALPVATDFDSDIYSPYTHVFTPTAGSWRTLGLTAGSGATIGPLTTWALTGTITGAGLVFNHAGEGTFNFDNFQINGTGIGGVSVASTDSSTITLSWVGNPAVRLLSSTNLGPTASWTEVPGSAGQSSATVNRSAPTMFFRLVSP